VTSLLFPISSESRERRRKVLVLHSYHQGMDWTDGITDGINDVFSPHELAYEIYYEYLDTKRSAGDDYPAKLFWLIKSKHQNMKFSVIIASDNNALSFVLAHGKRLYGDTPVVFCGINNFTPDLVQGLSNITGVVENTDFEGTINLMKKLHPGRRNIMLIVDRTPTGVAIKEGISRVLPLFPEIRFTFYQDFLLNDVGDWLGQLGDGDLVYLLTFNRDRQDNYISYNEGIEMVSESTDVPIYGSWDFYMGKGLVGGVLTRGVDQGRTAAQMALSILDGMPASAIPIELASPTIPMFDDIQLKRYGIHAGDLPEGSVVINLPPSWTERYAEVILVLFCVFLGISVLMGGRLLMVRQRTRRMARTAKMLEKKVAERTHLLEKEKEKLQETLDQVKTLQGLLPICASCKKIRDDKGYWNQIESYISRHTDTVFSHGLCPQCISKLYADLHDE
jgi:ABC-type uncharacterized transport system substrate-binding protein